MATISRQTIVVLFGATGDLVRLKLLPAMRELWIDGRLPRHFKLIAAGRREWTTAEYVDYLATIESHPFKHDLSMLQLEYVALDFEKETGFVPLQKLLSQYKGAHVIFFMSVGPDVLELSIDQFSQPEFRDLIHQNQTDIVVEKPFADNLDSMYTINKRLNSIFGVRNIYRNDHYLNKSTIKAIVPLRKQDATLQSLLDKDQLTQIDVLALEKIDVGTRATYFDGRGIAIDWLQSHMLQMLAILCADIGTDNFSVSKAEFIDSLEPIPHSIIRAQYDGYTELQGVAADSQTETFLAVQFTSNLKQWKGVTFNFATGKAMAEKQLALNLKLKVPHEKLGSEVMLHIDPAGSYPEAQPLGGEYKDTFVNVISEDWDMFLSQQEVEAQWRVMAKLQALLPEVPVGHYAKGTTYKRFCTEFWCVGI